MSARSSRFSGFRSSRRRGKAAAAVIACAVMLLAGCGGGAGSSSDAGVPVIRGNASTEPVAVDEGSGQVRAAAGVGEVVVSWFESKTSLTQSVIGYVVQVTTDGGGTWTGAGTGCANDATTRSIALTCTATELAAGTYSFRIATIKLNSITDDRKTTDFTPGSTDVTVIAAAGAADVTVIAAAGAADSTLTVSNTTLTGTVPTPITLTSAGGASAGTVTFASSAHCSVTGTSLAPLATYTAPVTCTVTATQGTKKSAAVTFTFEADATIKPATPAKPTMVVAGYLTVTVTVAGNAGGDPATSYTVLVQDGGMFRKTCTVWVPLVSCDVTGLSPRTTYTAFASATNSGGTSEYSSGSATVRTPVTKPGTPKGIVAALVAPMSASLTFQTASNADGTPPASSSYIIDLVRTNNHVLMSSQTVSVAGTYVFSLPYPGFEYVFSITQSEDVYGSNTIQAPSASANLKSVDLTGEYATGNMLPLWASEPTALPLNKYTRDGYEFIGWAVQGPYQGPQPGTLAYADGATYSFKSSITLYARWLKTWTVAFHPNDGSGSIASQSAGTATALTLNANAITRSGYAFGGWATTQTGSVAYADGATYPFTETTTLYAKWGCLPLKVKATAIRLGARSASVEFTASSSESPWTSFTASSAKEGVKASTLDTWSSTGTIPVSGLKSKSGYTFDVTATNKAGCVYTTQTNRVEMWM